MRRGAAFALALALTTLAGCGEGAVEDGSSGSLVWVDDPRVLSVDRDEGVVSGEVRNDSLRPIEIVAADATIVDRAGEAIEGDVVFLDSFVHGLYPPTREPRLHPDSELIRTGRLAQLDPGQTAPLTAAWRVRSGGSRVERIDYGNGSLAIP